MASRVTWNASNSKVVKALVGSKWPEIGRGLHMIALGEVAWMLFVVPVLFLAWMPFHTPALAEVRRLLTREDELVLLGLVIVGAGTLIAFVLALLGTWRCLMHAPQRHGAKELLFACLNSLVLGPGLLVASHFFGGARNYEWLERGLEGLQDVRFLHPGTLMQLGGGLLCLIGFLLFTQFLRVVAQCFDDEEGARNVERYFFFVCLVVGGSIGVFFCLKYLSNAREVLLGLAAGWLAGLVWHTGLVLATRRRIGECLARLEEQRRPGAYVPGQETFPKPYSGRFRAYQSPKP
jgi:hypothetical protein